MAFGRHGLSIESHLLITNNKSCALCKKQHHSRKQEIFVVMVQLKLQSFFSFTTPAGANYRLIGQKAFFVQRPAGAN
jgi:hypothetical protein